MSRRSRDSHKFAFHEADKLEFNELNFNRYEESVEQLTEGLIRAYIEGEAKAVQAERENDVSQVAKRATGKIKHPNQQPFLFLMNFVVLDI